VHDLAELSVCAAVNAEQLVGYQIGVMNTSSDKLILVDIISAYTKS
jgi:hypothetical protein